MLILTGEVGPVDDTLAACDRVTLLGGGAAIGGADFFTAWTGLVRLGTFSPESYPFPAKDVVSLSFSLSFAPLLELDRLKPANAPLTLLKLPPSEDGDGDESDLLLCFAGSRRVDVLLSEGPGLEEGTVEQD